MFRERAAPHSRRMFTRLYVRQSRADGQSPLSTTIANVCFARIGWDETRKGSCECFATSMGGESASGLKPAGSPDNWRCIALDKLGSVELLDDRWRTAPNHSRPASCIIDADGDAEDYPVRDPQQGQ